MKVSPQTRNKYRPTNILIPFSLQNRRSLTYRKLPEQLLSLSVLKLDGSSFSFQVARNATVGMVKLAIEEEFSLSMKDERKVLWWSKSSNLGLSCCLGLNGDKGRTSFRLSPLVWSNFCLCYKGQKLVSEKACIQKYGIKDGDQLRFIKHLRVDLAPNPQLPVTNACDTRVNDDVTIEGPYVDDQKYFQYSGEELAFPVPKSKLSHSLKKLLSRSRIRHS